MLAARDSLKKSLTCASSFNLFSKPCKSFATASNSLLDFRAAAKYVEVAYVPESEVSCTGGYTRSVSPYPLR